MTTKEKIYLVFVVSILALVVLNLIILLIGEVKRVHKNRPEPQKPEFGPIQPSVNIYIDTESKKVSQTAPVAPAQPAPAIPEAKPAEPVAIAQPAPVAEPVEEEEPEAQVEGATVTPKKYVYPKIEFKDELASKGKEAVKRYEKLIDMLLGIDPKMHVKYTLYRQTIKYLTYQICDLKFIRGQLRASFFVSSSEFKTFSKENGTSVVKEKPSTVIVDSDDSLKACLDLAQLCYEQAKEAKKNKKLGKEA